MATGFGDWNTSTKAHKVLQQIAQGEVERLRPASRLAEVTSINPEDKSVLVKFVGEQNEVKVPYTSTAPANTGQWVRIGGTTHDRHVEDVIGTTDSERRLESAETSINSLMTSLVGNEWESEDDDTIQQKIEDFFNSVGVDFGGLLEALNGTYEGSDPILQAIETIAAPLRFILDPISGLIPDWLIPNTPIGKLTEGSDNLFGDGGFEVDPGGSADGRWYQSSDQGVGGSRASAIDGNGYASELLSRSTPSNGEEFTFSVQAKSAGLVASGNFIEVWGYGFDAADVEVERKRILSATAAPNYSSLAATWTPNSASKTVVIGIGVTSAFEAGTLFIDNARLSKPASIPQGWIKDLLPDLAGLFDFIDTLVDNLLGSFGLDPIGGLFDRILDLGDELGDFFGLGQDTAGGLDDLLDGLLTNPVAFIGSIPQNLVSGLQGALDNANAFVQNLLNAILQGVRGIPVVGGTIANVIEDLTGLATTVETTGDQVSIVQTQVTAVQEVFSVTSTKPLWTGLDPTADVSYPLVLNALANPHTHSYDVFTGFGVRTGSTTGWSGVDGYDLAGQNYLGACIRVGDSGVRDQISFLARRTGTAASLFVYAMKLQPDGSFRALGDADGNFYSANLAGDLTTNLSWIQTSMPQMIVEPGDTILILFNASANVFIQGRQLTIPNTVSGFRPRNLGFETSSAYVQSDSEGYYISTVNADASYSQKLPYAELGRNIGASDTRSFYDNFNRNSFGANWLLGRYDATPIGDGNLLTINGASVENTSRQIVWQRAWGFYTVPLATDNISCEVDVTGNDNVSCGIIICANSTQGNFAALDVLENQSRIITRSAARYSGGDTRATSSAGGKGRWKITYDSATNTYRAYKNGAEVMVWTDTGGFVRHGKGERFCGLYIEHALNNSGPRLDNWHAYDTTGGTP